MRRLHVRGLWGLAGAAGVLGVASGAAGQDAFGRMVAVSGQAVLVGKPGVARGPAALYRFERDPSGNWVLVEAVSPADAAQAGHGLSPSLLWNGDDVVVGAADPQVRIGAHHFRRAADGLVHLDGLALPELPPGAVPDPGAPPAGQSAGPGGLPAPSMDFAGIMRILQPPVRTVAMERDRAAVSVAAGGNRPAGVHIYQRSGSDWNLVTVLPPPGPESQYPAFGAAVAIRRDDVMVSSPAAGGRGELHIFRPPDDAHGNVVLAPDSLAEAARFGEAMAVEGSHLLVGAPGSGQVFAYRRFEPGDWELRQVLSPLAQRPPDDSPAQAPAGDPQQQPADAEPDAPAGVGGFGATLAMLGDELWVGAPQAREGSGSVDRFILRDGRWQPAPLDGSGDAGSDAGGSGASGEGAAGPDSEVSETEGDSALRAGPGAALGSAIALGATVAVVGAPGTDGGYGAAMVLTREPGGVWGEPEWLRPGPGPDAVADGEVRCEDGAAAGFSCDGVDLLAYLPASAIGAEPHERVSDAWGWTDPETGREYALVGRTGGAAIVDVTDPATPRYVGVVPANPSGARDLKVYADHLFFTGDGAGDHGLIVFDLTRLRDLATERAAAPDPADPSAPADAAAPIEFEPDAVYRGIGSAHNLVMDAESGFAFPVGASGSGETCGGGLHMVDVRDPTSPVFAGCFTDTVGLIAPGRTHDAQCTVYRGPDDRYAGRQVCFISNESLLRIVDITDKSSPTPIGAASHPGVAYVHQGWLTDDHRYYYLDDELDELVGTAPRTRTYIYDVAELDDPILVGSVDGPTGATDHNLYVKGDRMYQANYQAGFRLFDISDPEAPEEIGWFDTTPYEGDPPGFVGAWTAYPYFDSGTVLVTSIYEGVFLLRPQPRRLIP